MLQFWKIISKIFNSWIKNLIWCPIILIAFKYKLQDISTRPIWSLLLMGRTAFWNRIKNTSGSFLGEQGLCFFFLRRLHRVGSSKDVHLFKRNKKWGSFFRNGRLWVSRWKLFHSNHYPRFLETHKKSTKGNHSHFKLKNFVSKCLKSLKIITNLLHTFFPSSLIFKKRCLTPWSMLVCVFIHLTNIESNCSKYLRHRGKQPRQWFISSGSQTSGWGRQIINNQHNKYIICSVNRRRRAGRVRLLQEGWRSGCGSD